MDAPNEPALPLFAHDAPEGLAQLAALLAPPGTRGHFDELRGRMSDGTPGAPPCANWARFFSALGSDGMASLDARHAQLARQVRDNGITYNVYAHRDGLGGGPQRPWSVDLFPLIVDATDWARIESGVLQRTRLLEKVLADVYGPQELLARNMLPAALVQGHPGYLRAMQGARPAGGMRLHIAAFDLARDAHGSWWVTAQRTQAPSGLGYLLENRLLVSRLFPQAFADLRVQRLAATYRAFTEALRAMGPQDTDPRIVLLTSGPHNETYFEHAYLARYLGLPLVEGSDLTVRDDRLYLRTLQGLEPVHGVLKRMDDEFLDPLELRADSRLGVPGLLQSVRAGNVLVANAPGSAFLESPALHGFLPAIARSLLGEDLQLPSAPTWWCGERAALHAALPQLATSLIQPTYSGAVSPGVRGASLGTHELDAWAGRILRDPEAVTVQADVPLSQLPTWQAGDAAERILPRACVLRVFAVADGPESWRVLPGGLTRVAGAAPDSASMQRGGSSADTWVLANGEVDRTSLLRFGHPAGDIVQGARVVTSRAAENLFWLGRYTERTENTARLGRVALHSLGGEDQAAQQLLAWLGTLAVANGLVLPAVPPPMQSRRVFERSLIAALDDSAGAASVGFNLAALHGAASAVRERLSQEQWNVIVQSQHDFARDVAQATAGDDWSPAVAMRALERLSVATAAMTGAQTDRMARDDGWRLLSIGRLIERLAFLAGALADAFDTDAVHDDAGYEAVLALFDSTITFHALYQQRRDVPPLVDLLVRDRDNPRSLAWVAQTLRGRIARLAGSAPGELPELALGVPDIAAQPLDVLCGTDAQGGHTSLVRLLRDCADAARKLSDQLAARYFAHTGEAGRSVGA